MLYVYNGYELELYEFKNMTELLYSLVGENQGSYIIKKML